MMEDPSMPDYNHILAAVDFSVAAEAIGKRALDLSRRYDCQVTLIHVVDYLLPLGYADDFTPSPVLMIDENELLEQSQRSLRTFAQKTGLEGARRQVLPGSPRQEIIRFARDHGVDLIVIGSHGRHGLDRLLGSTARSILNDAPCDVLAVRIKEA